MSLAATLKFPKIIFESPLPALAFTLFLSCFWYRPAWSQATLDIALRQGRWPAGQQVIRVAKDDEVVLRLSSDTPGELHLHGYRLEAPLAPAGCHSKGKRPVARARKRQVTSFSGASGASSR